MSFPLASVVLAHLLLRSEACSPSCLTCSTTLSFCLSCQPGYFLQPESVGLCYTYCPTGYTQNTLAATCVGTPGVVVNYVLDSITPVFYDKARLWPAQNGETAAYYPPTFEPTDPLPSKHRGYHFDGTQYVSVLPLVGEASLIPVVGTHGSVLTWMRPQVCSSMAILGKNRSAAPTDGNILLAFIKNPCLLYLVIGSYSATGSTPVSLDVWHSALFTFHYDPIAGRTNVEFYLDLVQDVATSLTGKLTDAANGRMSIGQEYDGYAFSDLFKGYIWQVKLYNYVISSAEYQAEVLGPSQPASASFQLSVCGVNERIVPPDACEHCLSSCSYGCSSELNCYFCSDHLCTYCTSFEPGSCVSCVLNASIIGGVCTCYPGYVYLSAFPSMCVPCHTSCQACQGTEPTQCLACKTAAYLSSGSAGTCECSPSYYPSPDSGNCQLCDSTCSLCEGPGSQLCTSCKGSAVLTASPGLCLCPEGWYPFPDASSCLGCHSACSTCTSGGEYDCATCALQAEQKTGTCVCVSGFYPSPDARSCQKCNSWCKECKGPSTTDCVSCYPLTELTNGACLPVCERDKGMSCVPREQFTAELSWRISALFLQFSSSLVADLQPESVTVKLHSPFDEVVNCSWYLQVILNRNIYEIVLRPVSRVPDNSTVVLSFINHSNILNVSGAVLCCASFETIFLGTQLASSHNTTSGAFATEVNTLLIVSLIGCLFSGGAASFWPLFNTLQILYYIPLSYLPLPHTLRQFFLSTSPFALFPNHSPLLSTATGSLPKHATEFGFKSGLFLENAKYELSIVCLLLSLLSTVMLLQCTSWKWLGAFAKQQLGKLKWGYFITWIVEAYLPLTVTAGLQIYIASNSSISEVISMLAAAGFLLGLAILPYVFYKRLLALRKCSHQSSFDVLIREFTTQNKEWLYYSVFCLRRMLYAATQLYLQSYPVVQACLNISHSISVLSKQIFLFCWLFVSYRQRQIKILSSLLELGTAIVFVLVQLFYFDLNASAVKKVENVVFGVIATTGSVYLIVLGFLIYCNVSDMLRQVRKVWSQQTRGNVTCILSQAESKNQS